MKFGVSLKDMLQIVKDILHREPYDKNEICSILDITTEELDDDILNEKTRHGECRYEICTSAICVKAMSNFSSKP